jgi:2-hydroxycyclohexanecarboxyl-CoA dehydrogenase
MQRSNMKLSGSVALVTGGASGIGEGIVTALADSGAKVIICDIDRAGGGALAARTPGSVFEYLDVTSPRSVAEVAERLSQNGEPVDILINCAGGMRFSGFLDSDEPEWLQTLSLNLLGTMRCSHVFARGMKERKRGRIINISSGAGYFPREGMVAYSAAKGGINGFTKSLGKELAPFGVTVNAILPGPTETPPLLRAMQDPAGAAMVASLKKQMPMGRFALPRDIAAIVVFFASEESQYITGELLPVNGGAAL